MIKVFEIGGASREEVEGIRSLLKENKITYYETPHSNYGSTTAAIWVHNEPDYKKAREIVDEIQSSLKDMNKIQNTENIENNRKKRLVPFIIFICIILFYMMVFGLLRP